MRHYNIPVFIPGLACPQQCIFCDQGRISGQQAIPAPSEVHRIVQQHLSTIPLNGRRVEIAFFGGSFTGLPRGLQHQYLSVASQWVEQGMVDGIRLSTRPDYIDEEILEIMKQYGVGTIELGAQSMDDEVLELSGRGHTAHQVKQAAGMILEADIKLGLQMMTGLPGDTFEKTMMTAEQFVQLGASSTRIYPTVVVHGTALEQLYLAGHYRPLELEEAVERCARLLEYFESHNVQVLRLGLHPSDDLLQEGSLLAGPWHPSLKELALTRLWQKTLLPLAQNPPAPSVCIMVAPHQLNQAIGYKASNKKMLEAYFRKVTFRTSEQITGRRYHADPC